MEALLGGSLGGYALHGLSLKGSYLWQVCFSQYSFIKVDRGRLGERIFSLIKSWSSFMTFEVGGTVFLPIPVDSVIQVKGLKRSSRARSRGTK